MPDFLLTPDELRARGGGKWRKHPADVLPAWVADMDFRVAPAVQEALERFSRHQDYVYGLTEDISEVFEAFAEWMTRRHGWSPDPALTVANADVIQGLVACILAFSEPGQGVVVQTPVYPPFLDSLEWTGRRLAENALVDRGGRYEIDVEGLERAAAGARILLLCNPQNPTGRVFTAEELEAVARIARAYELVIVADEIHADLVYQGARHVPMETVAPERTITVTSATKGFNIPGARASVAHFGTSELKERFDRAIPDHLLGRPSRFGVDATVAAWRAGATWLDEVLDYLDANRRRVARWAEDIGLGHHLPESTYLAWLDCRRLRLEDGMTAQRHFLERARVGLSEGEEFGRPGAGHVRLNFGTSAEILEEILGRLSAVLD